MTRCPRCNGSVLKRYDEASCLSCGWEPRVTPLPNPLVSLLREPRMSVKDRVKGSHCLRGHAFTTANTYERMQDGVLQRRCRRCDALRAAARKQGRLVG